MRQKRHQSDGLPNATAEGSGYVYIIGRGPDGPVKVGHSKDARKRVKALETSTGVRCPLVWASRLCSNRQAVEKRLHERMARFRGIGEWFNLPFAIAVQAAQQERFADESTSQRDALARAAAMIKPPSERLAKAAMAYEKALLNYQRIRVQESAR